MRKNIVQEVRPHMIILRMRIEFWIPKATNTHSQYITLIAFPLQQLLHERASELRHKYIDGLIQNTVTFSRIVVKLARLSCYTNDTSHWLPGLPTSKRKINFFRRICLTVSEFFSFSGILFWGIAYHLVVLVITRTDISCPEHKQLLDKDYVLCGILFLFLLISSRKVWEKIQICENMETNSYIRALKESLIQTLAEVCR